MKLRDDAQNQMQLVFPSRAENVAFARAAVAAFAAQGDFTLDEMDEIKVVVSEAVSNSVIHGYGHGSGLVTVEAALVAQALELVVEDAGRGIADVEEARQAGTTSRPEERMGLGFTFMEEYMTQLEVRSVPGRGTRLTMRKVPEHARVGQSH